MPVMKQSTISDGDFKYSAGNINISPGKIRYSEYGARREFTIIVSSSSNRFDSQSIGMRESKCISKRLQKVMNSKLV